ncbi:MAG: serine protease [Pleurocapsa sp. MO_226.B13]|nr:serine protease [Pleurocapsa sp. MO_226.B13]
MKSYLPIIASLFLASTPFIPPAVASETQIIAQAMNLYIKDNIAREISVRISSVENGGSGVIIAKQDNTYLVLTNNHVLRDDDIFTIQTHDDVTHQATSVANGIETNDDIALLQFSSENSYQTATINSAATPRVEQTILAVGYSSETGELVTQSGKIERVPDQTLKDGYQIGYSSNIVRGMSGGAILNTDGEVIGINGKSAFPIVNTGYLYQDGTKPTPEEIEKMRQLSWGIAIDNLLTQINSEIIAAYNLPLPETVTALNNTQLTGWLGELEASAKQITVRVDSSSGANGSGVIIAREGDTYTVLTADHVICEKNRQTRDCIDYTYHIVAPDDREYPVDSSNIQSQEGGRFSCSAVY